MFFYECSCMNMYYQQQQQQQHRRHVRIPGENGEWFIAVDFLYGRKAKSVGDEIAAYARRKRSIRYPILTKAMSSYVLYNIYAGERFCRTQKLKCGEISQDPKSHKSKFIIFLQFPLLLPFFFLLFYVEVLMRHTHTHTRIIISKIYSAIKSAALDK